MDFHQPEHEIEPSEQQDQQDQPETSPVPNSEWEFLLNRSRRILHRCIREPRFPGTVVWIDAAKWDNRVLRMLDRHYRLSGLSKLFILQKIWQTLRGEPDSILKSLRAC